MQEISAQTGLSPFKGCFRGSRSSLLNPSGRCSFAAGHASERPESHGENREGFLRRPSCSSRKSTPQNGSH